VLAERLGVSRQYVNKILGELESYGYVEKRERRRRDGGFTSNLYEVLYDEPDTPPCQQELTPPETPRSLQPLSTTGVDSYNVSRERLTKDSYEKNKNDLMGYNNPIAEQERRPKNENPKRRSSLPPDCPSAQDRDAAIAYWRSKGREDLTASVERSADKFRAYHEGKGTLAVSWAATWRTWYVNQIDIIRPPAGYVPPLAHRSPHSEFRDPSAFTPEDWQTRVCMALADNSKWIAEWGEPPRPGLSPEVQAIGYFEQHQKAKKE
jgi:hypothetical protein